MSLGGTGVLFTYNSGLIKQQLYQAIVYFLLVCMCVEIYIIGPPSAFNAWRQMETNIGEDAEVI